jgi:orotidine-5'-phosphate decarboxylase
MNAEEIFRNIQRKKSFLCVGLDTEYEKIPRMLLDKEYPIFEFNKHIIDATEEMAVAYKPNLAFYESMGAAGYMSLEMTISYIRQTYPDCRCQTGRYREYFQALCSRILQDPGLRCHYPFTLYGI